MSEHTTCWYCGAKGPPDLRAENKRLRAALTTLAQWDMLSLDAEGHGVATADAPWASELIEAALIGSSAPPPPG